jgi:hypothetical protein
VIKKMFEGFGKLPGPAKLVVGLLIVVALLGALIWAFMLDWKVGLALVIGLIVLLVLIIVIGAIVGSMGKNKGKPFEQELASNAGAAPAGVSEAASRARLDDLRRRFEEGVELFRRHGKDVYSLPWYMIVGEPGSGKTEVIRHSDIGFPPGLQDELQGSGGTINMDWWFTNHAIVLDTAGRLLFDEVGGQSTSEWKEFLKLLGKHRPTCPINGLMLVLPADSLIKDPPEEIEAKGARIARQLDLIQRTLDVRFPVFILITKADLINGFREFFDELDDPQLEHQMMGWSNQGELDDPFYPEDVVEHFLQIKDQLIRRRGGLMIDPVAREGEKRLNEIDAMYTFPESVEQIVPRLKKYLELIFAEGEWSNRPLFLRGIYFVSSMREGSALDQDLAEAMGVPLDTLPEGKLWERDRSYFLRDMFLEKMFRERGLVTRASDTNQLKRKRKVAMYTFTAVTVLLLLLVTFWQTSTLRKTIREPRNFWDSVAGVYSGDPRDPNYPVIVGGQSDRNSDTELVYLGGNPAGIGQRSLRFGGKVQTIASMPGVVAGQVVREIKVPFVFKPATWFSSATRGGNLHGVKRQEAAQAMLSNSVLDPLVRRAVGSIETGTRVGPLEGPVLVQLLRMYEAEGSAKPQLDPLFAYVLRKELTFESSAEEYARAREHVQSIQSGFDVVYTNRRGEDWPRSAIEGSTADTLAMLESATTRYAQGATRQFGDGAAPVEGLGRARRLEVAMNRFRAEEALVIDAYGQPGSALLNLSVWETSVPKILLASDHIREYSKDYSGASFAEWYLGVISGAKATYLQDIDAMLATLPEETSADQVATGELGVRGRLLAMRRRLEEAKVAIESAATDLAGRRSDLADLGNDLLSLGADDRLGYEARSSMYRDAEQLRRYTAELSQFVDLPVELSGIDDRIKDLRGDNDRQLTGVPGARINGGVSATGTALDRVRDMLAKVLFEKALVLQDRPRTQTDVEDRVRELASSSFTPDPAPSVTMTSIEGEGTLDARFHSRSGPAMIESLGGIELLLLDRRQGALAEEYREVRTRYAAEYLRYWADLIERSGGVDTGEDWDSFQASLAGMQWRDLNAGLLEIDGLREEAIKSLDVSDGALWDDQFGRDKVSALGSIDQETGMIGEQNKVDGAFDRWVERWRGLGVSFATARAALLNMDLGEFNNSFGHLAAGEGASVAFWKELTESAVLTLEQEGSAKTETGLEQLKLLRRFPLEPLDDSVKLESLRTIGLAGAGRVMSAEELSEAYEWVQLILPESESRASFEAGRLGHPSTVTGNDVIDSALRRMRGSRIALATKNQLLGNRRVLEGLSSDPSRPFSCRVEVLGTKPPSAGYAPSSVRFPDIQLNSVSADGERKLGQAASQLVESADLGSLSYPGDPVEFEFFYSEGGQRMVTPVSIGGAWAPIAMLHRFNGVRSKDDPTQWDVEFIFQGEVDGRSVTFSVWMRLTFEAVLPELADWGAP